MGPKKKGVKQGEEEDLSTKELQIYYRRRCKDLEIPICKMLDTKLTEKLEEDEHVPEILINEKIGETGARAIADALKQAK